MKRTHIYRGLISNFEEFPIIILNTYKHKIYIYSFLRLNYEIIFYFAYYCSSIMHINYTHS